TPFDRDDSIGVAAERGERLRAIEVRLGIIGVARGGAVGLLQRGLGLALLETLHGERLSVGHGAGGPASACGVKSSGSTPTTFGIGQNMVFEPSWKSVSKLPTSFTVVSPTRATSDASGPPST